MIDDSAPLADLSVLVLGLGISGSAMATWCARQGAAVTIWDSRIEGERVPGTLASHALRLAAWMRPDGTPAVRLTGGAAHAALLGEHRWVLKSPGLAPGDPRIAPLLAAAAAEGVPVWGELELFNRELERLRNRHGYAPQLLAVTGTNGKTTTTALTGRLVERAGRRVAVAGNIGPSLLDALQAALDAAPADPSAWPEVWVLELSSFQLHGVTGFEPSAAVVLNLTQDHLDWHGSMQAYGADKARVWGRSASSVLVFNRNDAAVVALADAALAPPAMPSGPRGGKPKVTVSDRPAVSFGLDAPRRPGDFGLVVENGMAWLVRALDDDEPGAGRRRRGASTSTDEPPHLQRLMPADALRIRGRHNAANALAALALATAIGCPLAPMLHGLREYSGEPHRVQHVATVDGIDAIDDSKGTNVGATVAAIEGLGRDREPARLALILGGDGKGQDFTPLSDPLGRYARAVATIGRDAPAVEAAIATACADAGVPVQRHDTLEGAVQWCFDQCRTGDAVVLSPACASLDMFRDYGHRAQVFVDTVHARAAAGGLAT